MSLAIFMEQLGFEHTTSHDDRIMGSQTANLFAAVTKGSPVSSAILAATRTGFSPVPTVP